MIRKLVCKDHEKIKRESGALNSLNSLKQGSSIHTMFTYFLGFILDKLMIDPSFR